MTKQRHSVWKYQLVLSVDVQIIQMPKGAEILHVHWQGHHVCMWIRLDKDNPEIDTRYFRVRPTGDDGIFPIDTYIGTAHDNQGLVWHVFEV
jgi:hypothetical protein